jgi:hypothetical protein
VPDPLQALLARPTLFDDFGITLLEFTLVMTLIPYLLLVTVVFPLLLFQVPPFDHGKRWFYPVLGLITLGLGTFLLHLLYVDPILCTLADRRLHEPAT